MLLGIKPAVLQNFYLYVHEDIKDEIPSFLPSFFLIIIPVVA